MFRFLNKKLLYTVNYDKQINIKPQNYENLFTFIDRKSTRLNSSHKHRSRMPSSA